MIRRQLKNKLKSESGASLALALLLVVVCIAISAIVINAASASFGHLSDQGKSDQRYYSVTSAAGLFKDSLGDAGELTVTFTQEKTTTTYSDGHSSDPSLATSAECNPATAKGFVFLPNITCQALCGKNFAPHITDLESSDLIDTESKDVSLPGISYTIKPPPGHPEVREVEVKGILSSDWLLELELASKVTSTDDSSFKLYMSFVGEPNVSSSTTTIPAQGSGESVTAVTETTTRITKVTWKLDSIVPGRGLSSA